MGSNGTIGRLTRKRPLSQHTAFLLLALVVAFLAAIPLIAEPGFLNTRGGGDSPFLLQRLQQLESALRDGHFPVRWMPDAYYGYGYPFYNFYAPLSIYIAVVFRFLGFPFVRSIELAQLAGFLVAAWGMFLLARRFLASDGAAFLASVAYTAAPFHMVNIYVRGDSLAEFWAMALYPWVILAADNIFEWPERRFPFGPVSGLALAYAALILSHNISALIFSPFLLLFIFLRWLWQSKASAITGGRQDENSPSRHVLWAAAGLFLGLGLSAWFFLPALAEQNLAQLAPVTEGYFHYSNHFRGIDLLQPSIFFDYNVSGGNAFRMGFIQGLAALAGTVTLLFLTWRRKIARVWVPVFIILSLLISTLMITPLSRILWDNLPLLSFTQFPWRFLSVQAFFAALAAAALGLLPQRRFWVPLTAVLLLLAALSGLRTDHLIINDSDITAERLAWYEWFTGNIGSTVSAEYLPPTVKPRAFSSSWLINGEMPGLRALSGDLENAQLLERKATEQKWLVEVAGNETAVMFPTLNWPGWTAEVNGDEAAIASAPGSGLIVLELQPGQNQITLRLTRTPIRLVAELLSLAVLIIIVYFLLKAAKIAPVKRPVLVWAGLAFLLLLVLRFWPQSVSSEQNLTWDFAQMGYLHHDVSRVPFDNGVILDGYDYDRESILPGESLFITLILSDANGQAITVSLETPAGAWPMFDPQPPKIASATASVSEETARFELALPQNAPSGLVVPKVTMDGGQPLTPSGRARGDLYLRPLRIEQGSADPLSGTALDVRALTMVQTDDHTLQAQLRWQTDQQFSQNYNASLRLIDQNGSWLAQMDAQPGYGFLPSSGWRVGEEVNDWLALRLPDPLPEDGLLALVANLYDLSSGDSVLIRRLGLARVTDNRLQFQEQQTKFTLPDDLVSAAAEFGDLIRLEGYTLQEASDQISLTLYWRSITDGQEDYTRFVHLYDPETGEILAQVDSYPQHNSYPTSQWVVGEIVTDKVILELNGGLPEDYEIGVGFYRQEGGSVLRLTAVDGQSAEPYADDRVPLLGR